MKKVFIMSLIAAMALLSCSTKDKAVVSVQADGVVDSTAVYFSRLSINKMLPSDTVYIKSGKAQYKMSVNPGDPQFVYLSLNGKTPVLLLVSSGENIKVKLNNEGNLVSMSGSEESSRLQEIDNGIRQFNYSFDSVMTCLAKAVELNDQAEISRQKEELAKMLIYRKRDCIKIIYQDMSSLTAFPIIYQKTNSDIPIFSQPTDAILFEKMYDSLYARYPESSFLVYFSDEIARRKNIMQLENKIKWSEAQDFPEIALTDINGDMQVLSSLKGNLIVLLFWDINNVSQRVYNTELAQIYNKYHKRGLEIYQVALTTDKTAWAVQVKEQKVPWISVCDPMGASSAAATAYNVKQLPAMFLISKDAEIVAKDLFDLNKLESEILRQL